MDMLRRDTCSLPPHVPSYDSNRPQEVSSTRKVEIERLFLKHKAITVSSGEGKVGMLAAEPQHLRVTV